MGLALADALPEAAPERVGAEAHARTCADCARARRRAALAGHGRRRPGVDARTLDGRARARRDAHPRRPRRAQPRGARRRRPDRRRGRGGGHRRLGPAARAHPPAHRHGRARSLLRWGWPAVAALAAVATVRWGGRLAVVFPLLSALTAVLVGTGRALDAGGRAALRVRRGDDRRRRRRGGLARGSRSREGGAEARGRRRGRRWRRPRGSRRAAPRVRRRDRAAAPARLPHRTGRARRRARAAVDDLGAAGGRAQRIISSVTSWAIVTVGAPGSRVTRRESLGASAAARS